MSISMQPFRKVPRLLHPSEPVYSSQRPRRQHWIPPLVVATLAIIVFLVQYGLTVSDIPSQVAVQGYICSRYYGNADPALLSPQECDDERVFNRLNTISMVSLAVTAVSAILTALLYGTLSDSWGRKKVFLLSIFGLLLSQVWSLGIAKSAPRVPIETISSAGLAVLIGGGISISEAMVFTMISDISHEKWRTTYFQIVICSVLIAEIVGSVTARAMMATTPWPPLYLGLGLVTAGLFMAFVLPETLHMQHSNNNSTLRQSSQPVKKNDMKSMLRDVLRSSKTAASCMQNQNIALLVPAAASTLPLATTALTTLTLMIPYRYTETFLESTTLVAVRAATTVAVLIICVPLISYFWQRISPFRRDYTLVKFSSLPLVVGMFIIAASPALSGAIVGSFIFSTGSPVPGLARSMLAQMVEKEHLGRFFGLLSILEQTGFLVVGLSMGGLYSTGLRNGGGPWLGLPFYVAGALFVIVAMCLWIARPEPLKENGDVEMSSLEEDPVSRLSDRAVRDGGERYICVG
ncbi:major facilitator superfamily domain-containing protein [Pseudomassariella vexata]|uniref:Major facilitator superfamily domain-containing protein n=1 Tax=Pseudomassariella vexata TaxID=1141098 RepID=A0A1Y2DJM8_9PEZI|nr:major facilitator superfamily domain-containing protein [Pseudomassariella vexata]ORY59458.1 major facilitator superfamily domain-containing protein [Pseudomassariella vexata]